MAELIITNGDAAAATLAEAGVAATILAWRDVLHEGPIRGGRLAALSAVRAPWLAERFGLDPAAVAAEFEARDGVMAAHAAFARVTIWLEHDLYDQLQLLQILAFFAAAGRFDGLHLVQADDFLGRQSADTILRFAPRARPVDAGMLATAAGAWRDLAAPTPAPVAARLADRYDAFPFLVPALRRFLEELPDPATGLGRTEAAALSAIAARKAAPADLFRAMLAGEEAAFMGDWSFFRLLDDLASGPAPLIAGLPGRFEPEDGAAQRAWLAARLELTAAGAAALAGVTDRVAAAGIDRWWAGTHLAGRDCWRWDRAAGKLAPPAADAYLRADPT